MNVLIVGGAGYVGGAITDILKGSEHNVLVYDHLLYEETYRKDVPFIFGDIRDKEKLKKHLDWADVVVWLAALVGDPACSLNESLTIEINKESVEYLKDNFDGRIIFMSTCSVYGAADQMLDESSKLNPLSLYARTKLEAEGILADTDALMFRLGTLHGISDAFSRIRFDLVVNTLVMRAAVHGKISVFGGTQYRPLLHVRDVAAVLCANLNTQTKGIYNLHSENIVINEIADVVKEFYPDVEVEKTGSKFQDNRNYQVSSDKAVRDLGFSPKVMMRDSIAELKDLLAEGRIKDSFIDRFSNYHHLKPLLHEYSSPLGKTIEFNI